MKELNGYHVCSICGRLHPQRFLVDVSDGKVCYLCAYDCLAEANGQHTDFFSDVSNAFYEDLLSMDKIKAVATAFAPLIEAAPDIMNSFDDFSNVANQMVLELKTNYTGTIEALFEQKCNEACKSKFRRNCRKYLDMEQVEAMIGQPLTYDNFDELLVPKTADPKGTLRIFKLIRPDYDEVVAAVNHMMENEEVISRKIMYAIEETPAPMWKN